MTKDTTRPLPKKLEMAVIGDDGLNLLRALSRDKAAARALGRASKHLRTQFDRGFSGETRDRRIPIDNWERAGYVITAAIGRVMGLREM